MKGLCMFLSSRTHTRDTTHALWKWLAALTLTAINSLFLLLLPALTPEAVPSYSPSIALAAVNLIGVALMMFSERHREYSRREREALLRLSNERLHLALATTGVGVWEWDRATDTFQGLERVAELLGHAEGSVILSGAAYLDHFHPADRAAVSDGLRALHDSKATTYCGEHRVVQPDGTIRWLQISGCIEAPREGGQRLLIGTMRDITTQVEAETGRTQAMEALQTSERRFRALIDNCGDAVALFDDCGIVQYLSPAVGRILGYDLNMLMGADAFAFTHPDDGPILNSHLVQLLTRPQERFTAELRVRHADGSWRWLEATAVNSCDDPAIAGVVVNFHDITYRKAAETSLRVSEERYRAISELVSDFAFALRIEADGAAAVDWVTDAITRITGYPPEAVSTLADWDRYIHPADEVIAEQHMHQLRAGLATVGEYRIIAQDGRTLWLRSYGRPVWDTDAGSVVRIYGAVQDVTRIRQLEQQLTQAQKMDAIGRMAGGIAHDFNNLLSVIQGSTRLLQEVLEEHHPGQADVELILRAAKRGTDLTRQLLVVSRRQVLNPQLLDLNHVIVEVAQLLRTLIRHDVIIRLDLAPNVGEILADQSQIEQVLMNLVINARDALPEGGQITITTMAANGGWAVGRLEKKVNSAVLLTVHDTGVGMDACTKAQVFEPFFTTKPDGTGLGLATVHAIITQSGGQIWVDSEPGRGTIFSIILPSESKHETGEGQQWRPS
jgi:two-component system, cell cycle sensor histidine kinase and response regulator CckA